MPEFDEFLSDALDHPKDAVYFELSRALKAAYPECYVLETQDSTFQLHGFAHAGLCRMREAKGAHSHWTSGWDGRSKTRWGKLENGALAIEWEGFELLVVTTGLSGLTCRETRSYLVAPTQDVAQRFFDTVCRWGSQVHGEVLVFQGGRWSKSEELHRAIEGTHLNDLILPAQLKRTVVENVRGFFESEATYERYRLPWKRGLLFLGPPGNGKTHMIKGLANELGRPVLYVRSFASQYGTPHDNIGKAFEMARDLAPCLFILEDLDALVDDTNRSYFLNEMDGFYANQGILTLATTNHPERLDPAILERPSRFDRKFTFGLPEREERLRYLAHLNAGLETDLQLTDAGLVRAASGATDGFSYAYLKELILSSMMAWMREDGVRPMDEVLFEHVEALAGQMRTEMSRPTPRPPTSRATPERPSREKS